MGPELQHQSWQFWKLKEESTDAWWKYWMLIHWSRNTSLPRYKPIYVISEFSKKKVWSKQDSVRRQHHIKRFFASWPCRTLVQQKFTKLSTLKARGQRRRRTQCLKITQKMSQFYKIHIFEKFTFLKSSHFWKIQIFIKFTCVVCTKFAPNNIFFSNHSKFLACEKKWDYFFVIFKHYAKEEEAMMVIFRELLLLNVSKKGLVLCEFLLRFHMREASTYSNTYVLVFYKLMLARILKGKVLLLEILTSVVVKDTEGLFWRWSISALSYCFTDDDLENQCSSTTLRLVVSSELLWVLIRYIRKVFLNRNLVDMLKTFSRIKYR